MMSDFIQRVGKQIMSVVLAHVLRSMHVLHILTTRHV
jgi:hypothetical protein